MESIVRWCLKNKSVVILATLLLVGSGAYATTRLNQELLPDISLLPLGLSSGGNGLISSSLAITVVGGLATSTFLTLLVVPVGYSLPKSGLRRKRKV